MKQYPLNIIIRDNYAGFFFVVFLFVFLQNQETARSVPDPFPRRGWGLGDETTYETIRSRVSHARASMRDFFSWFCNRFMLYACGVGNTRATPYI